MKHLLSWRLALILAAAALLGGCRTTPPPTPSVPQPRDPAWVRPKPHDPTRVPPKPRALAPEPSSTEQAMLVGYDHHAGPYYRRPYYDRPFWRAPGAPRGYYYPARPWRGPGYVTPRPMPMPRPYTSTPRPYPERWRGGDYIPNPGLRQGVKPGQSWGSPGDTRTPRLEYRPMALSNQE